MSDINAKKYVITAYLHGEKEHSHTMDFEECSKTVRTLHAEKVELSVYDTVENDEVFLSKFDSTYPKFSK